MGGNQPWWDSRFAKLIGCPIPIVLAPMGGVSTVDLAVAVSGAGGLGSLAMAGTDARGLRNIIETMKDRTPNPYNLNFFAHSMPASDSDRDREWLKKLRPLFEELEIPAPAELKAALEPFGNLHCAVIEEMKPPIVSFHFGLPPANLVSRIKAAGTTILSSATTVAEARWLEANGADAVIAQGLEAGGHRGMFRNEDMASQMGTLSLVPQVADAVKIPVIAAGGIADGRGIAAALMLGADAVQIGTGFLRCPEAETNTIYRKALDEAEETVVTNVISGRPSRVIPNRLVRELGPISLDAPAFPKGFGPSGSLRKASEANGSGDFSPFYCGQSFSLGRSTQAAVLTRVLANETKRELRKIRISSIEHDCAW